MEPALQHRILEVVVVYVSSHSRTHNQVAVQAVAVAPQEYLLRRRDYFRSDTKDMSLDAVLYTCGSSIRCEHHLHFFHTVYTNNISSQASIGSFSGHPSLVEEDTVGPDCNTRKLAFMDQHVAYRSGLACDKS